MELLADYYIYSRVFYNACDVKCHLSAGISTEQILEIRLDLVHVAADYLCKWIRFTILEAQRF